MLQIRVLVRLALLAIFCTVTVGCASNAGWQYTPGRELQASSRLPISLAIERFEDKRETENSRYFWACMIPLVPYCTADYHRPDTANGFLTAGAYNFRPSEDLAQAAASDIRNAGMFRDVFVTDHNADPGATLVLRGAINNTDWNGTMYSYLLGPYGSIPWLFALPVGSVSNTLNVRLELAEASTGRVLWTTDINQGYEQTEGLYYNFGTDFGYSQMFREGMAAAVTSMKAYIASQPPNFWETRVGKLVR
jgi:hypothetical protein